jgi:mannosyltransferase
VGSTSGPRPDPREDAPPWRTALAAVVLLAAALRVHGIDRESLWFDEGHSLQTARLSPGDLVASLAEDVHPPLYFLVLSGSTRVFGESDAALRMPSAVLGTLAVLAFFLLGRRLAGTGAGLAAAFLSAVSPFHVAYSQEARPYALLLLLCVVSTHALARLVDDPRRAGRRVAYGALAAAVLYTHANGVFLLAAHAAFGAVAIARAPRGTRGTLLAAAGVALLVAGALLAPWVPSALRQVRRVGDDGWIPVPTLRTFRRALAEHAGSAWAFGLLALLSVAGVVAGTRERAGRLLLLLVYALPLLGPVALSLVGPKAFLPRTAIASTVGLLLLAGTGLAWLATRGRSGVAAAIAALALLAALSGRELARRHEHAHNEDLRGAAAIVDREALPGDVVVVGHPFEETPFEHYLRRDDLDVRVAEEGAPPGATRVWLLPSIHTARRSEVVRTALEASGYRHVDRRALRRVDVDRWERAGGP